MSALGKALESLALSSNLEEKINHFNTLFLRWNRSINLSGARDDESLELHIIDSLHAVPPLRAATAVSATPAEASPSANTPRILDVGSGGGLPAVLIALALPSAHVTALEPVRKKHAFLRTAARELELDNFDALPERLEAHPHRDYDAATSRATFDLREWLELGLSYVRPGGLVLGFEAIPRLDLPAQIERSSYVLANRTRSIVSLHRPAP